MCHELIHVDTAFEVSATLKVNPHGAGTTLEIITLHPTARNPTPHKALTLTLPHEALVKLGRFLTFES